MGDNRMADSQIRQIRKKVFSPAVVLATVVFACVGAALSYGFLLSYKSQASVHFERNISDFRTLQAQVSTPAVFDRYWQNNPEVQLEDAGVRAQVLAAEDWLSPIFRVSKKDARELPATKEGTGRSDLVGYQITALSADPEMARRKTDFLAHYVDDMALKTQLDDFIFKTLAAKRGLIASAALERDAETYDLSLVENRLADIARLSKTYPAAAPLAERQMLVAEKNTGHYLPLPVQMVAAERARFDIREKIALLQRRIDGLLAEELMLVEHEKLAQTATSGKALALALIQDIKARLPAAQSSHAKGLLARYEDLYASMMGNAFALRRFIVAPTLPEAPTRSPLKVIILFAGLGFVLGLAWQFRAVIKKRVEELAGAERLASKAPAPADEGKRLHVA